MIDPFKLEALVNWLFAGAPPKANFTDTFAELTRRMLGAGLPIATLGVYMLTINPIVRGTLLSWSPGRGMRQDRWAHAEMATDRYVGTLPYHAITSGRMVRLMVGSGHPLEAHPATQALRTRGYSEYIACPLFSRYVSTSGLAIGTKQPGGFDEAEVAAIRRLQAPLARVVEAEILHENMVTLLSTYVGRNAGEKVMDGRILRGYSEEISAVILFADLAGFTALSNSLPAQDTIATLNSYFEALDTAIRANGGETLKFIGDGLLAIFPTVDEFTAQTAAAMGAISALDDARASLAASGADISFRAALHMGEIHYGNIGSPTRLDFTAVGPAVNLTARMLQACTELGAQTVCSDAFVPLAGTRSTPARAFSFKGFDQGMMIHTLG